MIDGFGRCVNESLWAVYYSCTFGYNPLKQSKYNAILIFSGRYSAAIFHPEVQV